MNFQYQSPARPTSDTSEITISVGRFRLQLNLHRASLPRKGVKSGLMWEIKNVEAVRKVDGFPTSGVVRHGADLSEEVFSLLSELARYENFLLAEEELARNPDAYRKRVEAEMKAEEKAAEAERKAAEAKAKAEEKAAEVAEKARLAELDAEREAAMAEEAARLETERKEKLQQRLHEAALRQVTA